jgi:hypothetical protein
MGASFTALFSVVAERSASPTFLRLFLDSP